jgi:hypothetical protein
VKNGVLCAFIDHFILRERFTEEARARIDVWQIEMRKETSTKRRQPTVSEVSCFFGDGRDSAGHSVAGRPSGVINEVGDVKLID